MDTDDIAFPYRFEKQISYLKEHPEVDILGSSVYEFKEDIKNTIYFKQAPTENIGCYIKKRNPLNHPTVIFKKNKVLEIGNYQEILFNEDYYLWIRMFKNNCQIANMPEPLLYFRINDDTYRRRGGWKYVKAEWKIQRELLRLGIINKFEFMKNVILKTGVRLMPNFIRKFIYINFLRKKEF